MKLKQVLFVKSLLLSAFVFLTVAQAFAQRPFNKSNDILIAQFDSKPDPDDIQAQAALGSMLAHPDFDGVNYYAVAGAIGKQGGRFIDSDGLFDMAFGSGNWTDADANRSASVTNIKNKVKPILQAGGKVWVQEAGQSDITRDWIQALLNDGVASNIIKTNVIVVQHSVWNEDMTSAGDLNWVKNNANYKKIADGNSGGNGTPGYRSTNTSFLNQAKASNNPNAHARALWTEADRVIQNHGHLPSHSSISVGGVDYSDCVENWWIFSVGNNADNISKFWSRYVTNTPVVVGNNSVVIASSPASVEPGESLSVTVNYESAGNNEIVAIVNSPTGTWLNNDLEPVSSGSGTVTLTVTQTTNWAVANNYALEVLIRPVGSGYGDRFDLKTTTFNVIGGSTNVPVTGVDVTPNTVPTLTSAGATVDLNATVTPSNATNPSVTWSSSNTSVATVNQSSGLVTAVANGTATITATSVSNPSVSGSESVTVNISTTSTNLVQNPGFETGNINSWVGFGTRTVVSDAASGSNAVQVTGAASLVQVVNGLQSNTTYTLSAQAKVQSGSTVLLGVKDYGGAEKNNTINNTSYSLSSLTFTTGASNTTAKIYFYVSGAGNVAFGDVFSVVGPGSSTDVPVAGVDVTPNTVPTLTSAGATVDLNATVTPSNATNPSVTWSSSNTSVAIVNQSGLVTAVANGTATITATSVSNPGVSGSESVTVNISTTSTNLVQNPGLETGNINGWAGFGTRTVVSDAASGSNGVQVTGAGSLVQVVSGLQSNTTYTLSAQAKVQSGSTVLLGVKDYGGAEKNNAINNTSYSSSSLTFTTGASNTTAKIYFYVASAGNVAFGDDFSVVAGSSGARLGIDAERLETRVSQIKLYPNPLNDQDLNISLVQGIESQVEVFNLQGRQVLSRKAFGNVTISRSTFAQSGMYLIRVKSGDIIERIKLMVR